MKTLLVDGSNLLIRSIKAMERSPLSVGGIPTGGLMTFINMMARYVREEDPTHVVVCWDDGSSAMREQVFRAYKATRPEHAPDSPDTQVFGLAKLFLSLAGIPHLSRHGYEADDLIAWFWGTLPDKGDVVILSADKDFFQLLGPAEQIRPGDDMRWTASRVEVEFGCSPERMPLLMALTGDKSDGVPGVRGVGAKTASKALAASGWDLDRLLTTERFVGHADLVRRNLALVNLREGVPGLERTSPIPSFHPTRQGDLLCSDLLAFLEQWQMKVVSGRFVAGQLWRERRLRLSPTIS